MSGETVVFKHIRTYRGEELKLSSGILTMVVFDGEPELWVIENNAEAMEELKTHYQSDWKGTNRVLPVYYVFGVMRDSIDCK